jgi:uncharacterized protein YbbC (DUF1343 family)
LGETPQVSERVHTGIERLLAGAAPDLRGRSLGLIAHPASVTPDLQASHRALMAAGFDLRALFGPQHGARGEKQDNMIESGAFVDPGSGLPVHSLYGDVRKPTRKMLAGLDALLFDLQDVGVRVYTFIWTMALAMEACAEAGVRFVVLDRPNPIGGVAREGPVVRPGFESFVGLHPIPLRHGLTCGELARWLNEERGIGCSLEVVPCEGWRRRMQWEETGLPWVLPSPNLPTPDSCRVYPGMVLLEGTNLSEGRGTARPFELFGAPWIEPERLADRLDGLLGPGVAFRPCHFEPTFQKHAGRLCGGGQLHVLDERAFRPVHTAVAILSAVRGLEDAQLRWRDPPYEYETQMQPIDILWGHDGLRRRIDAGEGPDAVLAEAEREVAAFTEAVAPHLLYD